MNQTDTANTYVYIGGWGYNESAPEHGFSLCRYHRNTGTLTPLKHMLPDIRVGGVCFHPARPVMYCTDERTASHPEGGGQILALSLEERNGHLSVLNERPSFGSCPAYCAVDGSGEYLLVVNHGSEGMTTHTIQDPDGSYRLSRHFDEANVVLFPLYRDGSLGLPLDIIKLTGNGPGPLQKSSHPHCVMSSPDGSFFVVCDFGADRVYSFAIDYDRKKLRKTGMYSAYPGSAPRYCAFHPARNFFFVNNEVRPYIEAFQYNEDGSFSKCGEAYVLPETADSKAHPLISDLRIHPSGNYLYNLSRAFNMVTVLTVEENGRLQPLQYLKLPGDFPKGCMVSPDGKFLYIAMKKSGEVLLCRIGTDGALTLEEQRYLMKNAANLSFYTPKEGE